MGLRISWERTMAWWLSMRWRVLDIRSAGLFLDAVTRAVELALSYASQVEHRLAQCLRRDRAGVGAHTAQHSAVFDHRYRFAEFGCGDGRLLSTGAGTDDDQVDIEAMIAPALDERLDPLPELGLLGLGQLRNTLGP